MEPGDSDENTPVRRGNGYATQPQQIVTTKSEINKLKRLIKAREVEIANIKSSMANLQEKYKMEIKAKEELLKQVTNLHKLETFDMEQ